MDKLLCAPRLSAYERIISGDFVNRKENGELLTPNSIKYWTKAIKKSSSIPLMRLKASTVSFGKLPKAKLYFLVMIVCSRCFTLRQWTSLKNGPADVRNGGRFIHSFKFTLGIDWYRKPKKFGFYLTCLKEFV